MSHAVDDRGWRGVIQHDPPRTLFDAAEEAAMLEPQTLEARFQRYHAEHPEVFEALRDLALTLVHQGWEHFGISTCWEVLRYRSMVGAKPDEDRFKLNDNYKSRFARLLADQVPELADVFETRRLRSAQRPPAVCAACAAGSCRDCHGPGCSHECDVMGLL